jgi:hypothetical protein
MFAERPLAPWWARLTLLTALALLVSLLVWWPLIESHPRGPWGDGEYFQHMIEAAKASLVRYHELPLWNPYECGGAPLWDNPESFIASPIIFLSTGLDSLATKTVWYVVHVAAGFVCMWLFVREEFRLSRVAAFLAATLWAFGVAHSSQYAGGHDTLVAFLYLPLVLLLWRRAEHRTGAAVGLGVLFGWMFYESSTYPLPHAVLILAAETLTRAYPPRRLIVIARAAAIVIVIALLLGSARLLPVLDQLTHHKRIIPEDVDHLARWSTLRDMYLAKTHPLVTAGQQYVWGEYIAYVGKIVLALATIGVLVSGVRNAWFFALAGFVFVLMLGKFAPYAPWAILQEHVPFFTAIRCSARFRLSLAAFFAVYGAFAVDRVPVHVRRFFGRRFGGASRVALVGLALIGAGDVTSVASDVIASKFGNAPAQTVPASTRLYFGGAGLAAYIDQPRQNRGRVECGEHWIYTADAPVWQGDGFQARAFDDSATVERADRTQNTFTIAVTATRPTRVRVNSGYDRGWRTDVGTVTEERHLLVVDVPAGRHMIHLRYWPRGLTLGLWLSAIGVAIVVAFLFRAPIGQRWQAFRAQRDVR